MWYLVSVCAPTATAMGGVHAEVCSTHVHALMPYNETVAWLPST